MKKTKVISLILAVIIIALLVPNMSKAYTGELDPQNYISFGNFSITDGVGKATISVSSEASDYTLSYQRVDMTESAYNNCRTKMNTYKTAINGNASEQEINTAKAAYYAALPDYTSSWTATTLTANNATFDFTNETGNVYFTIWAKLSNGTNTYYDASLAACIATPDTDPTDDPADEPSTPTESDGVWTDFSNAKVETVQKEDFIRNYFFTISDVTPIQGHTYSYAIGDGTSVPAFSTQLKKLSYDSTKKVFYSDFISNYLEQTKDYYVYVYENYVDNSENVNKLVLTKVKLEKPEQKKYTDAFYATIITKDIEGTNVQILFNTPWAVSTERKVTLKVGKISDTSILKNIYNKKATAFEDLLSYAKETTGIYNKTLNSNDNGLTGGGIKLSESTDLLGINNIVNDDYYFLYAVVEDENGTYVKTEGVTFARASKFASVGTYQLNFYGSNDFSWMEFVNDDEDTTTAKTTIPQTGESMIIFVVLGIVVAAGTFAIVKYRKNNF